MFYITVKQSPMYHQMSLEEFLFGTDDTPRIINPNMTNTRTYEVAEISDHFLRMTNVQRLIRKLKEFNAQNAELRARDRHTLYYTFYIPKKSRGFRRIDAPEPELMSALRNLKTIFEVEFGALYHTSAFAYVKNRSTLDAVKRHQANESKWFGKYDLSNFFGSTTMDFVMKMFAMVFPFSEVIKNEEGKIELQTALELAFLDGGLPQGTPISPLITNIMMIPIDFKLANGLREFNHQRFVYTRYADDFLISSKYGFNFREVEKFLIDTLASFGSPFTIKPEKTRYGSSSGRNWNLGVMLTADNRITVGHKRKRQFQAALSSFILDTQNGNDWDLGDIQQLEGYRNYYRMVEKETIDGMIEHINNKFGVNVVQMIKDKLRV